MGNEPLKLKPFQEEDLAAWLALPRPRALINANDMTMGKTVDAVVCARESNYPRILVACTKSMRPDWQSTFKLWWPERQEAAEIAKGFFRKAMSVPERQKAQLAIENPTHIVSYGLLKSLVALHRLGLDSRCPVGTYDFIVVDEFHEYQDWNSDVIQALWELRRLYPQADFKPLSGTPVGTQPLRLWPWLKLCEPNKWGRPGSRGDAIPFVFRKTYGQERENQYAFSGFTYSGVNEARLPQFQASIRHLVRRRTTKEVGLQLPPMRFEIKRFPADSSPAVAVADWCEQLRSQGHVPAVFTHNLLPMEEIETELRSRGIPYGRLYQEHSRDERVAIVQDVIASGTVLLSTTRLVSTGVNYLSNIKFWMLAQPNENPTEVQQLARRFARLSSKDAEMRVGFLLYREGEEFSAQKALATRLQQRRGIISASQDAEDLESILDDNSNQSFLDTLRTLGRNYVDLDTSEDEEAEESW